MFLASNLFAANLSSYSQRFKYKKNSSGHVVAIYDHSLKRIPSFAKYVTGYLKILRGNAKLMSNEKTLVQKEMVGLSRLDGSRLRLTRRRVQRAFRNFDKIQDRDLVDQKGYAKIDRYIQTKMKGKNVAIVSNLVKPGYFYKANVFNAAFNGALSLAGSLTSSVGGDIAVYFVKKYFSFLISAKKYRQTMLAHYLSHFNASSLGLSEIERSRALSSVLEADLHWYEKSKADDAREDWDVYGAEETKRRVRVVTSRVSRYEDEFEAVHGAKALYHMSVSNKDGVKQIYNFFDKRKFLDSRPSLSFDTQKTSRIRLKRVAYEILKLSSTAIPVPGIGYLYRKYLESATKKQIKREGALFALSEVEGDTQMMELLRKQAVNPFL